MKQTLVIAKREVSSLFYSPIAYVVLGLFALGMTLIFLRSFGPREPATLRPTLEGLVWVLIFLAPAISMRLLSEEYRQGTVELLMTAPVNDTQVVMGKWLGAMGFFLTLLLPVLALVGVLEITAAPDYGPILCGLLGLILVGGLYLAIGLFASAATQNQMIAFILAVFIILLLTLAMFLLEGRPIIPAKLQSLIYFLNVNREFEDFNKGLIDLTRVLYFGSGTALFLFLAVLLLQSRRWR